MLTEKERKYLLESMENLLQKYNYQYTTDALNKIIDEWYRQKKRLIEAFKKHPNYVDGQFAIVVTNEYARDVDMRSIIAFRNWWSYGPYRCPQLVIRRDNAWYPSSRISDEEYEVLYRIYKYDERNISKSNARYLKKVFPSVKIHAGEKMTRVVNKIFEYLGYSKHPEYNKEFAKYSDAMTPKTIKRRIVLSLNPLDYFTMSFGNSWSSCHTIDKENMRDMPHGYNGMYSSGTMSYMLDCASMVMYTVDQKYAGNEYWTQDKITRQMYHYDEDKLIQSRLYPQSNDNYSEVEYKEYAKVVKTILSFVFAINGNWNSARGVGAIEDYVNSEGTHYRDYCNFNNCTLNYPGEDINTNIFTVGADPICIRCGERHNIKHTIDCCSIPRCKCCGRRIEDEDDIYTIDGEIYCNHCVFYCEVCEKYHVGKPTYIRSEYANVCDTCLNEYYEKCEECGEYVKKSKIYTYKGKKLCRRCHQIKSSSDGANRIKLNSDWFTRIYTADWLNDL